MNLHRPDVKVTDAGEALQLLKDGNKRYLSNKLSDKNDYKEIRQRLANGQQPFAIVLCCSDSRVSPEIVFDQKLGNIFVVRNAGNVVDEAVLGTIEYGVEYLGSPLVVVMGHSQCGAVAAACKGGELSENIQWIVHKIAPSVEQGNEVDQIVRIHIRRMADQIRQNEIIRRFNTVVESACYNTLTGEIEWL